VMVKAVEGWHWCFQVMNILNCAHIVTGRFTCRYERLVNLLATCKWIRALKIETCYLTVLW